MSPLLFVSVLLAASVFASDLVQFTLCNTKGEAVVGLAGVSGSIHVRPASVLRVAHEVDSNCSILFFADRATIRVVGTMPEVLNQLGQTEKR